MNSKARLMEEAQVDGPKDYQRRIREEVLDMEITKSFIKTIDTKWLKKTGRSSTVGGETWSASGPSLFRFSLWRVHHRREVAAAVVTRLEQTQSGKVGANKSWRFGSAKS